MNKAELTKIIRILREFDKKWYKLKDNHTLTKVWLRENLYKFIRDIKQKERERIKSELEQRKKQIENQNYRNSHKLTGRYKELEYIINKIE